MTGHSLCSCNSKSPPKVLTGPHASRVPTPAAAGFLCAIRGFDLESKWSWSQPLLPCRKTPHDASRIGAQADRLKEIGRATVAHESRGGRSSTDSQKRKGEKGSTQNWDMLFLRPKYKLVFLVYKIALRHSLRKCDNDSVELPLVAREHMYQPRQETL